MNGDDMGDAMERHEAVGDAVGDETDVVSTA